MSESPLKNKSFEFAVKIVKLSEKIINDKKDFVISKQILKSGTSIGALIREAEYAQSIADFINKMNIALKEANETEYWLLLLKETFYISEEEFKDFSILCKELIAMLIATIKTSKKRLN